ncbi:lysine N(6)-hydroxylase/L-ornithine N(5)-oxygenase family protein [Trinickia diaoshuihuensis]|uniref:lysine N(6)-hydroxylase/L-ornithine N(5)-oxygenase family protein n=1 Tax=Trinickia diaoshuihuensis TaxID=2292265 RepID=UPI000E27547D|nr:lysine N(6)-hydroxylase/L-ornithine N(5)-oxygenase family protein [Trinickia diaoshuihuensis]
MSPEVLDLAGIGIGPFNLSLAAQLDPIPELKARFFDTRSAFAWHPGMLLPGAQMQTSILKDLVTGTNPTSPWSFLSYLVAHKRFYQFINAEYEAVPRREFSDYLQWVAAGLSSLRFGASVREVTLKGDRFAIAFDGGRAYARNVSIAVGKKPSVPEWAERLPNEVAFHSNEAARHLSSVSPQRIAVIGGGQSGAEIVDALFDLKPSASICWISRRPNFEPIDATPFTNELFSPGYMECFHGLPERLRLSHVRRQVLASDGISPATLKKLYRRIYERKLDPSHDKSGDISLRPHRDVFSAERRGKEVWLTIRNGFDETTEVLVVDAIVLATGYRFVLPDFFESLRSRMSFNALGEPVLQHDFSLSWDGPRENRIFLMNAGRYSHGIAEPQLSLAAWRSAVIANALLGRRHFDLAIPDAMVQWGAGERSSPSGSEAAVTYAAR